MLTMHELPSFSAYFESDEEFSLEKKTTSRKKRPIDVIGEDTTLESDIQHARKTKRGTRPPHQKTFDDEDPWDFLPASTHKNFLSLHNEEPEELCIVNTTNEILLSTDHEQRLTMRQKAILHKEESLDLFETEQLLSLPDPSIPESKKSKALTEEQQMKKLEKNKKKKEQSKKQVEQEIKTVIDKLLNRKSLTKRSKKGKQVLRESEPNYVTYTVTDAPPSLTIHPKLLSQHPSPMIRYISNSEGNFLCFEESSSIEIAAKPTESARVTGQCSIPGCHNMSKYRHSKTLQPVCSLVCYKAAQL